MPNFGTWLGSSTHVSQNRSEDAWARIQQKPSSITLFRTTTPDDVVTLAAQTVRAEYDSSATETGSGSSSDVPGAGISAVRELTIFGVKDHPIQPDTDIRRNDMFTLNGADYIVVDVIPTLGEIQAKTRRVS